jgi:hypothetical protein
MPHVGGKKGRKVGKGSYKLSHSKWGSYAGLIARQQSIRLGKMGKRYCKDCEVQFHSTNALHNHTCHAEEHCKAERRAKRLLKFGKRKTATITNNNTGNSTNASNNARG